MATADHFESRSEDEDEYDLGEMETEAEEERDIFEMPPISTIVGRAQRSGMVAIIMDNLFRQLELQKNYEICEYKTSERCTS